MDNPTIVITKPVKEEVNLKELCLENALVLPERSIEYLKPLATKESTIHIYDLGFKNNKTVVPIKNHINKTGINPLRGEQDANIQFYDITTIYNKQGNSKIAECFGKHNPLKINNNYIQTRFLCNHVISAYFIGFKNIFAYVIN